MFLVDVAYLLLSAMLFLWNWFLQIILDNVFVISFIITYYSRVIKQVLEVQETSCYFLREIWDWNLDRLIYDVSVALSIDFRIPSKNNKLFDKFSSRRELAQKLIFISILINIWLKYMEAFPPCQKPVKSA